MNPFRYKITLSCGATRLLGLESNNDVIEQLDEIKQKITSTSSTIHQNERASMSEILVRMESFEHVDVLGYTLADFTEDYRGLIKRRVEQGAQARFITVNPNSTAGELLKCERPGFAEAAQRGSRLREGIRMSLNENDHVRGIFDYLSVDTIPSVSAIIIDPNKNDGLLRLVFYPFDDASDAGKDRLCLMIHQREYPEWFEYYLDTGKKCKSIAIWSEKHRPKGSISVPQAGATGGYSRASSTTVVHQAETWVRRR